MNLGTWHCGHRSAAADTDRLDRRDRHQGLRQTAVEFSVPLDVAAEPWRHRVRNDLESATHRVAGVARAIDLRDHLLLDRAVGTMQRRLRRDRAHLVETDRQRVGDGSGSDADHVADDVGADNLQKLPSDCADGDARGGFACAGALEDIAHVVVAVLHEACKIGVPGTWARHRRPIGAGRRLRHLGLHVHRSLPVLPVFVWDE